MLTAFVWVQLALNLVLVLAFTALLRERRAAAQAAEAREARLEGLAAELCTLGRAFSSPIPRPAPPAARPLAPAAAPEEAPLAPPAPPRPSAAAPRLEIAAALLARGDGLEAVAAETAVPEGELRVLQNLRRPPAPRPRSRRAAAEPTATRGRRPVHPARPCPASES